MLKFNCRFLILCETHHSQYEYHNSYRNFHSLDRGNVISGVLIEVILHPKNEIDLWFITCT